MHARTLRPTVMCTHTDLCPKHTYTMTRPTHTCTYLQRYTHANTHPHTQLRHTKTHTHACIHTHTNTHTHACTCKNTHAHTHMHAPANTHTCTYTHFLLSSSLTQQYTHTHARV